MAASSTCNRLLAGRQRVLPEGMPTHGHQSEECCIEGESEYLDGWFDRPQRWLRTPIRVVRLGLGRIPTTYRGGTTGLQGGTMLNKNGWEQVPTIVRYCDASFTSPQSRTSGYRQCSLAGGRQWQRGLRRQVFPYRSGRQFLG